MYADADPKKRSLSEISHLFLTSVRERQTQGADRPVRTPPARVAPAVVTVELTPEEMAQVGGEPEVPVHAPPITAVLASHLGAAQMEGVKNYARDLAAKSGRIGLIELDAAAFRLFCFDPSGMPRSQSDGDEQCGETYDPRQMSEALAELNCDVNHWLVLATSPRSPEARRVLREIDNWTVLSNCDHEGMISSYRFLKGLAEISGHRPRLDLALLEAISDADVTRVNDKLGGVCRQFLGWELNSCVKIGSTAGIAEHLVLSCQPTRDKAQMSTAPQWELVAQFIGQSKVHATTAAPQATATVDPAERQLVAEFVVPTEAPAQAFPRAADLVGEPKKDQEPQTMTDVIELDGADATPERILAAMLGKTNGQLIECPVRPPMCPQARLAVTRERTLVLLAAPERGLGNLRPIAQALRWLVENRSLVAMALPQFAIDATQYPRLRLLVDQADLTADLLQPMLGSDRITVQSFRRVRWGEKVGFFLEAA